MNVLLADIYTQDQFYLLMFAWWLVWTIIGCVMGSNRNRGGTGFLLGAILGPIGLIILANMNAIKECPHCKATIIQGATKCKYCASDLVPQPPPIPRT